LIGKGTGHPSGGGGGDGSNVVGELDNGSLSIRSGRDNDNISGVLDGNDSSGGQLNLLPGLLEIDDVDTTLEGFMGDIRGHVEVKVGGPDVALRGEEPQEIFLLSVDAH